MATDIFLQGAQKVMPALFRRFTSLKQLINSCEPQSDFLAYLSISLCFSDFTVMLARCCNLGDVLSSSNQFARWRHYILHNFHEWKFQLCHPARKQIGWFYHSPGLHRDGESLYGTADANKAHRCVRKIVVKYSQSLSYHGNQSYCSKEVSNKMKCTNFSGHPVQ